MRISAVVALALPSGAYAVPVVLKPLVDLRLRAEQVNQDGLPPDAEAKTARLRNGVVATEGHWSALVEAEATLALDDRYFDGIRGSPLRPLVADPENIELNRAQISYALPRRGIVTAGRELLELADQRFVGSSDHRQNQQTFDAVRLQATPFANLTADLTYAWSDRTVNGIDGRAARQQAISGDNLFALIGWKTPLGTLTGFAYVVDADEAAVQAYRLSSTTYGARFTGSPKLGRNWMLGYAASLAIQRGHHRNPNDYRANYGLAELGIAHRLGALSFGYEVLGADNGVPLTSFQTPYASLFKFQGWADKFTTTTPPPPTASATSTRSQRRRSASASR